MYKAPNKRPKTPKNPKGINRKLLPLAFSLADWNDRQICLCKSGVI